jgi:hypothetical protein
MYFTAQTLFSWGLTVKMKGHVSSSISQFCVLFRKRRGVEGPVFLSSRNRTVGTGEGGKRINLSPHPTVLPNGVKVAV